MPYTITFHCHTEPLWGHPGLFGLTLSVSVDLDGASKPNDLMQVFPWKAIDGLSVAYFDGSAIQTTATKQYGTLAPNPVEDYRHLIEDQPHDSSFYGGGNTDQIKTTADGKYPSPRMMSILADLATRPSPIATQANLSMYFAVGSTFQWAAPGLKPSIFGMSGNTPLFPDKNGVYPVSSIRVLANVKALQSTARNWQALDANNKPTFWVKRPAWWTYQSDPTWQAQQQQTMSDLHNVALRMVQAARAGNGLGFKLDHFSTLFFAAMQRQYVRPGAAAQAAVALAAPQPAFRQALVQMQGNPRALAQPGDVALTVAHLDHFENMARQTRVPAPSAQAASIRAALAPLPMADPVDRNRTLWNAIASRRDVNLYQAMLESARNEYGAILNAPAAQAVRATAPAPIEQLERRLDLSGLNTNPGGRMFGTTSAKFDEIVPPYTASGTPHPFAMPVSSPDDFKLSANGSDPADSSLVSGFALMVRASKIDGISPTEADFTPWRCCSVARVKLASDTSDMPKTLTAVIPERASVLYQAQQQVIFYQGSSKGGRDPLSDLASGVRANYTGPGDTFAALFEHKAIMQDGDAGPGGWASKLPALKFGRLVEGAVLATSTAGALPAELSTTNPGELRNRISSGNTPDPVAIPDTARYRELYLRRVPVGAPESIASFDFTTKRIPGEPYVSPSANLVALDRELSRDVLYGQDARNTYFAQEMGRGEPLGPPDGPGTLDLPAEGWRLAIERIDLSQASGATLQIKLISSKQKPITIALSKSNGYTAVFTQDTATKTAAIAAAPYVDVTFEAVGTKFRLSLAGRSRMLGPIDGESSSIEIAPSSTELLRTRVTLDAAALGGGYIGYRQPQVVAATGSVPVATHQPIHILLAPDPILNDDLYVPKNYTVSVRRPAADLLTWDRWYRQGDLDPAKRAGVIANYFRQGQQSNAQVERLVDDPAAERIFFEWVPVWSVAGNAKPISRFGIATTGPNKYDRSAGEPFTVSVNGSGEGAISAGDIWELRAYTAVRRSEFPTEAAPIGRMHPGMLQGGGGTKDARRIVKDTSNVEYVLFGPVTFRFEVAIAAKMPAADDKHLARSFTRKPDLVTASLDRSKASTQDDSFWAYINNASLDIQQWRWMGRPFEVDFPFKKFDAGGILLNGALMDVKEWETHGGYNGREARDSRSFASTFSIYDPAPVLWKDDISSDLRALYYRFRVALSGRYAALGGAYAAPWQSFAQNAADADSWTARILIRCRQTVAQPASVAAAQAAKAKAAVISHAAVGAGSASPKPAIRLVVPLTQAGEWKRNSEKGGVPSDPMGSPGVLVLSAERWYGFAGLGEQLDAEILSTGDEFLRTQYQGKFLKEFGYDPILTASAFTDDVTLPAGSVIGPIGHTLDVGLPAPIFRACSFIVKLPPNTSASLWPMTAIRFRRRVDPDSVIDDTKLDSAVTPPFPIQFLPDSMRLFGGAAPETIGFKADKDSLNFSIPFAPPENPGMLWAVVTEVIFDAFGIEQEKFYNLYMLNPNKTPQFASLNFAKQAPRGELRARLIELQISPKGSGQVVPRTPVDAMQLLFPADRESDALCRIVGVSTPVNAVPLSEQEAMQSQGKELLQ